MERRHYTREFKLEAVRLAGLGEKTKAQAAAGPGIRVNQLRQWRDIAKFLAQLFANDLGQCTNNAREKTMNWKSLLAAMTAVFSLNAHASLKVGDVAPNFVAQATQGGKVYSYSLDDALKKGPVVLYFYPAAFTPGCTIEAHDFAEAIDQYKALGASVIGVSHDPIDKLKRFSVSECRSKFPVAADTDGSIMKAYDAVMPVFSSYAYRTSYVIAPDHRIYYVYSDLSPAKHVANTLAALKRWKNHEPPIKQ